MAAEASEDAMDVESQYAVPPHSSSLLQAHLHEARSQLRQFLTAHVVHELIPTRSRVLIVDAAISVRDAFRALGQNGTYFYLSLQTPTFSYPFPSLLAI